MGRVRRAAQWVTNYRTGVSVLACVLVVLLTVIVVDSITSRDRALDTARQALATRDQTAATATRRIDSLSDQIATLEVDLQTAATARGRLAADIDALEGQIRQMCGTRPSCQPVVTVEPASPEATVAPPPPPTTAGGRAQPPLQSQPPTTTTTTTPPTTTTPTTTQPPPCLAVVLGRCVP